MVTLTASSTYQRIVVEFRSVSYGLKKDSQGLMECYFDDPLMSSGPAIVRHLIKN